MKRHGYPAQPCAPWEFVMECSHPHCMLVHRSGNKEMSLFNWFSRGFHCFRPRGNKNLCWAFCSSVNSQLSKGRFPTFQGSRKIRQNPYIQRKLIYRRKRRGEKRYIQQLQPGSDVSPPCSAFPPPRLTSRHGRSPAVACTPRSRTSAPSCQASTWRTTTRRARHSSRTGTLQTTQRGSRCGWVGDQSGRGLPCPGNLDRYQDDLDTVEQTSITSSNMW